MGRCARPLPVLVPVPVPYLACHLHTGHAQHHVVDADVQPWGGRGGRVRAGEGRGGRGAAQGSKCTLMCWTCGTGRVVLVARTVVNWIDCTDL